MRISKTLEAYYSKAFDDVWGCSVYTIIESGKPEKVTHLHAIEQGELPDVVRAGTTRNDLYVGSYRVIATAPMYAYSVSETMDPSGIRLATGNGTSRAWFPADGGAGRVPDGPVSDT
jgi:hypothetical protein